MSPVRLAVDNDKPPVESAPERPPERARLPFVVCLALWIVAAIVAWSLIALGLHFM